MAQITVSEHWLTDQLEGSETNTRLFQMLLPELLYAAKLIAREVSQATLHNSLGETGEINVQGERVQKLDAFANQILTERLSKCGAVFALGSEEMQDLLFPDSRSTEASLLVFFDPLDGSSNIDCNICIGTIFSIFRHNQPVAAAADPRDLLRPGLEQIAAGYFLYGAATMLVYTCGNGVHAFTLDNGLGEFLLSQPNLRMPDQGSIYSVNTSYYQKWPQQARQAVDAFARPLDGKPHSLRYVGSLVADFHRTLMYGGIFMYPEREDQPEGKLRLVYEAAPMAFLAEQAGGDASDGRVRILEKRPGHLHQRTPLFIGSRLDVLRATQNYQ